MYTLNDFDNEFISIPNINYMSVKKVNRNRILYHARYHPDVDLCYLVESIEKIIKIKAQMSICAYIIRNIKK
jgi:hypothetical protein